MYALDIRMNPAHEASGLTGHVFRRDVSPQWYETSAIK